MCDGWWRLKHVHQCLPLSGVRTYPAAPIHVWWCCPCREVLVVCVTAGGG